MAGTVGELLKSQHIAINEHDVIAPGTSAKLTDGTVVAVQFGRQLEVSIDGKPQSYWTTATNVGEALTALGLETRARTSPSAGVAGSAARDSVWTSPPSKWSRSTLLVASVIKTTGQTVADALAVAKIKVDSNDKLSVRDTARLVDGASFRYIQVDVRKVTKKTKVAYSLVRKNSDTLAKGTTKVDVEGRNGVRTIVVRETRHNGKVKDRKKLSSTITTAPVTQVILVGTKVAKQAEVQPQVHHSEEIQQFRQFQQFEHFVGQCLGQVGTVRGRRQLVDQYGQRFLRWPAVHPQHLACLRRNRHAARS